MATTSDLGVYCARTGALLRDATPAERDAFVAGQTHRHAKRHAGMFTHPVTLDEATFVDHTGTGQWYGGAGF